MAISDHAKNAEKRREVPKFECEWLLVRQHLLCVEEEEEDDGIRHASDSSEIGRIKDVQLKRNMEV